jgi:hypothetical protein
MAPYDTAPPSEQPPAPPAPAPLRAPAPPLRGQPQEPAQPPPPQQLRVQPAPVVPSGQWVHTQQYGWVWMPYGDQYVYTPEAGPSGAYPYEYIYAPSFGWTWVAAPWVWGWGPRIYFSVGRPHYYGWYRHPHFVGRGFIRRGVPVRGFRGPVHIRGGFRGGVRAPIRGGIRGGFRIGGHGRGHR